MVVSHLAPMDGSFVGYKDRRLLSILNKKKIERVLGYEYFRGDNGAGLGTSHRTGWTGTVARVLDLFGRVEAKDMELEITQLSARMMREQVAGEPANRK